MALAPGERFPDLDLPDHTGLPRQLSEMAGTVVETALFEEVPPPPGPSIERCAAAPWPGGRF